MVCLITGADGGLGASVCTELWRQGWHLHAAVQDAAGEARLRSLPQPGGLSLTVADLTQPAAVAAWVAAAPGPFQAVVHLVGGWRPGPSLAETTDADLSMLLDVNLRSTIHVLRAVLPPLQSQQQGSIVLTSARSGLRPTATDAVYGAVKAAVAHLARSAAEESRPHHVRVNAVAPGTIRQPERQRWATPDQLATFTPPEDIAAAIAWLVSPAAAGVSGVVLPLYGGIEA